MMETVIDMKKKYQ